MGKILISLLSTWLIAFLSYEFAQNEFVTALACVTLETSSAESGNKEFIAVGTTIDRGEDLAAKGSVRFCAIPSLTYA
jgi:cleavage and polyadenylation specificity factor subunit 1